MVSSFIPLARRGDRLILPLKMVQDNENLMLYISSHTFLCMVTLHGHHPNTACNLNKRQSPNIGFEQESAYSKASLDGLQGPGLQWCHLPSQGSLQTAHRCGCLHLVWLSEWLVFYSLKKVVCSPSPASWNHGIVFIHVEGPDGSSI